MGVWRGGRGRVRQWTGCGRVWIKYELLDRDDLLAIAKLLQLAKHRLDLLNERLSLCALQLAENFL